MNVAYAVAVAILDHAVLVQQFSPGRIDSDDVWELIPKITAHHNTEFDAAGPMGRGRTNLKIKFKDGSSLEASRMFPRSIEKPITNEEIVKKYRSLTNGLIDKKRQAAIEKAVVSLEKLKDVRELTALLAGPVGSAFD
jgi:2-methylcitrate dehydratase PrpD